MSINSFSAIDASPVDAFLVGESPSVITAQFRIERIGGRLLQRECNLSLRQRRISGVLRKNRIVTTLR